jgi:hypothetical protein
MRTIQKKTTGYKEENMKDNVLNLVNNVGAKLKLVEKQESDTDLLDNTWLRLTKKLKPNTIYMVTYYSGVLGDTISTLLPIGFDGKGYARAYISADYGGNCRGVLFYNNNSNTIAFHEDNSHPLDPITKLEIYELTNGVVEPSFNVPQEIVLVPQYNSDSDEYVLDISNYHYNTIIVKGGYNTLDKNTDIIMGDKMCMINNNDTHYINGVTVGVNYNDNSITLARTVGSTVDRGFIITIIGRSVFVFIRWEF